MTQVPDGYVSTLRAVQVAARRVLDLCHPQHIHIEGHKAKLDAAVTQLTRRQAHFDWEVLVKQRATAALEGGRNPAAVLVLLFLNLTTEGGAPLTLPPPLPAHEGLVLMESKEEKE
ncbi:MAG: hypothetical protein M1840_003513 [Geoglossum simile]|nr:MAG: hypothetical protein M1840_003513 [Geoglossum simile]